MTGRAGRAAFSSFGPEAGALSNVLIVVMTLR